MKYTPLHKGLGWWSFGLKSNCGDLLNGAHCAGLIIKSIFQWGFSLSGAE